jgi:hypothetical protein
MADMRGKRTRQLKIDFLGNIATIARNYSEPVLVAYELVQNAADAKATRISFDFHPGALIVENDAPFRMNPSDPVKDDFKRLSTVTSGLKREEKRILSVLSA